LVSFLMLGCSVAQADELRLINGDRVTGRLVSLSQTLCMFEAPQYATVLQVQSHLIAKLETSQPVVMTLTDGERYVGPLTWSTNAGFRLMSARSGVVTAKAREVARIEARDTAVQGAIVAEAGDVALGAVTGRGGIGTKGTALSVAPQVTQGGLIPPATPSQAPVPPPADGSPPSIGQQEEDAEDLGRIFLRNTTVLLSPGEIEAEAAFSYARDEVISDIRSRDRDLTLDATLRVGLLEGLEGYVTVPFGYAEDQLFVRDEEFSSNRFGLGDISFGLRYLVLSESDVLPEVTLGLDVLAPVGKEPNLDADTSPALGSGRWRVGGSLTFVRSYDPAVIFGTLGYNHGFEGTVSGDEIGGGHVYSYALGAGFAVNNQITLSGQFQGAYQTQLRFNDAKSVGSDREPMSLRSSLTYRIAPNQYIEPSIQYGLNDDAADAILTLSYTGRL
jgi:Putative MetA-pathway of phenol degradation